VIVIYGTLEYEHVYSWNIYGDELCDYRMQMYVFVTIDVLGGVTEIGPSIRQRHPTGGTGMWFPPSSYVMLIYKMFYCEWHNIVLVWIPSRLGIVCFEYDD
jgi:hypothetical protein